MEEQMPKVWVTVEPNVWKYENPEDSIEGVYITKKEDVGVHNSKAYYIENKAGQHLVWGSTVLDDRMSIIKVGEYIKITFMGTQKNQRGQDTKIFKVQREERAVESNSFMGMGQVPEGDRMF